MDPMAARTSTIPDVEIVSVGEHAGSTGLTKVTREDLEAMLSAEADGLVDHAPVKLGHRSALNDALGDGAPAYGWVRPTKIITNAEGLDTLVGDLVGVPTALAEVAPTAYRRRSAEIAWGIKTAAGKAYNAALVGLALLGATPPAVKGLADVVALYSAPADWTVTTIDVVDGLEGNPQAVAMLSAATSTGATMDQVNAYAKAAGAADTASIPPPVPDADNDDTDKPDTTGTDGRNTMSKPTDDELRKGLGLAADADVTNALKSLLSEREDGNEDPAGDKPTDDGKPAGDKPEEKPAGDKPAEDGNEQPAGDKPAGDEPATVTLSAEQYKNLTEFAAAHTEATQTKALDDAIATGRIAPSERPAYAKMMASNAAGTVTLLSELAPARFPITETGITSTGDSALSEANSKAIDDWEASTFPGLKS